MELAKTYLERVAVNCQRAINKLDMLDIRRTVGLIDELQHDSEAAKWLLINQIIDEEGKL